MGIIEKRVVLELKPLSSQIIKLTKSILLRPAVPARHPSRQFITGGPLGLFSGFVLAWWYAEDTFYTIESVAGMLLEGNDELRDCDLKTAKKVVMDTLQALCVIESLFEQNKVRFAAAENLFECRNLPVTKFADEIEKLLLVALKNSVGKHCVVHTLPRFKGFSLSIEEDAVHLISQMDEAAWSKLSASGYEFQGWSPLAPCFTHKPSAGFSPIGKYECVLVSEDFGTQEGARQSAVLKFRKLVTILYAIAAKHLEYQPSKSGADSSRFCIQFQHQSNPHGSVLRNDIYPVSPYFTSDIFLNAAAVDDVKEWYRLLNRCAAVQKARIEKATHFFNRGLNSGDVEAYVNYFVSLDALFGERGSVEASILRGVGLLDVRASLKEKASWLFDLRNELVHGGSRFISEWPDFLRYRRHFGSDPMRDVEELARLAVLGAPELYEG